jgi:CBS domain-containing protein
MYVRDILSTKGGRVTTIKPESKILATSKLLSQHRIGAVLVTDASDKIMGIISERDIVRGLAGHGGASPSYRSAI